jgi:acetyl esterase/lipase
MRMYAIDRLQSSGNKTVATTMRPGFNQRIGVFLGLVGVALPAIALAGSIRLVSPTDAARRVAENILAGITKKDASLVAPLCATPFLGGAPNNQRIAKDSKDLGRALHADLCQGPYGPFMFEPKWEIKSILTPADFRVEYGDYLAQRQDLQKLLEQLELRRTDRVVVENLRGMLIIVREDGGESRSIGIVPMGFGPPPFKVTRDVIYGRRHGIALTLAVAHPPKNANGSAVVFLSADSFVSFPKQLDGKSLTPRFQGLLDAGFTLFFVTPGSAPKHTIPEILGDIHTAVRFIRFNADRFQVDRDRIAMMGASACGYLSLMLAVADGKGPTFPPNSDPSRVFVQYDPVDAVSSRVQAVISFCPATDWLNYDENGKSVLETALFQPYLGLLDLYDYDFSRNGYTKISNRERHLEELKKLSPVYLATAKAAPILLIHGDKDSRVPVKHSVIMFDALKKAGAKAELIVKTGSPHDWPETPEETAMLIKWLNEKLLTKK